MAIYHFVIPATSNCCNMTRSSSHNQWAETASTHAEKARSDGTPNMYVSCKYVQRMEQPYTIPEQPSLYNLLLPRQYAIEYIPPLHRTRIPSTPHKTFHIRQLLCRGRIRLKPHNSGIIKIIMTFPRHGVILRQCTIPLHETERRAVVHRDGGLCCWRFVAPAVDGVHVHRYVTELPTSETGGWGFDEFDTIGAGWCCDWGDGDDGAGWLGILLEIWDYSWDLWGSRVTLTPGSMHWLLYVSALRRSEGRRVVLPGGGEQVFVTLRQAG